MNGMYRGIGRDYVRRDNRRRERGRWSLAVLVLCLLISDNESLRRVCQDHQREDLNQRIPRPFDLDSI